MTNLVNTIENYIKRLLDASPNRTIVLQRKELAESFNCVPSQINYVLSTRFTSERGYLVESRRGGGGYVRVSRLDLNSQRVIQLLDMLKNYIETGISMQDAFAMIDRLIESRIITRRESNLMKGALLQDTSSTDEEILCRIRAVIFNGMLEALLRDS